ncbi:MAG: radical SAM family heme chaperone HemW [Thermoleophilia bacterium]
MTLAAARRRGLVDAYFDRLAHELEERRPVLGARLATVYVGGGTPTVVPLGVLRPLVAELAERLEPGGEFTIEANPGGLEEDLLESIAEAGVTRISLGVQSFDPRLRENLGRDVSQEAVEGAVQRLAAARAGLFSWNLDLVFGIPGQDLESAVDDLKAAVASGAPHVSLYDLSYTGAYAARVARILGPEAKARAEEFAEEFYSVAVDLLEAAGLRRYEVSNFARPGHESRHNYAYWRGADYVGLGAAAVSTVGFERRSNPASVQAYVRGRPPQLEPLTSAVRLFEKAMLGLRTAEGVDAREVGGVIDWTAVDVLVRRGMAERCCGKLRLTRRGLDLSNAVLASILK